MMKPNFIRKHKKAEVEEGDLLGQERVSISVRSIIIGLILVALVTYAGAMIQIRPPRASMGRSHFPWPPIFVLFALLFCINAPLYLIRKSLRLRSAELLTIFSMTFVSAAIPTYGLMIHFCASLGGIHYIDGKYPESELVERCGQYYSSALEPSTPEAVRMFYEGIPQKLDKLSFPDNMVFWYVPWKAWLTPLFMWLLLVGFMYMLYLCIATILSKQWIEYEKLPFAAAQVPLALVEEDRGDTVVGSLLKNRLIWIGFAIPFLLHSYNAVSALVPDMVGIPLLQRGWAEQFLTEAPWKALNPMDLLLFPTGIAFIFLISREVSFSLLFFYALLKFQVVIAYYLGIADSQGAFMGGGSYFVGQAAGGLIMLAIMGLWIGRAHVREVFTKSFPPGRARVAFIGAVLIVVLLRLVERSGALGAWFTPQMSLLVAAVGILVAVGMMRGGSADDSRDILPYRVVAVGLPLSAYGMARWCEIAGMSFWIALLIVAILIVIAIALTRLVAEGGVLHLKAHVDPISVTTTVFGEGGLGAANLTVMNTLRSGFLFELPAFLMPAVMNAIKIGWEKRCSGRRFGVALIAAVMLAVALSFYLYIGTAYEMGAMKLYRAVFFGYHHSQVNRLCGAIDRAKADPGFAPDWRSLSYMGLGGTVMFFMCMMRQRFLWFVHPLGYIAWISPFVMNRLWFPILIGWLTKTLVVKFGGHSAHEKVKPFFIGIIAGESVAITLWSLLVYSQIIDIAFRPFGT